MSDWYDCVAQGGLGAAPAIPEQRLFQRGRPGPPPFRYRHIVPILKYIALDKAPLGADTSGLENFLNGAITKIGSLFPQQTKDAHKF